ncbi:hypothetical protein AAG570_010133 [Ranatra chinensis]|uniref:Dynein axonemal intermediate chain 4 n=1 Tax=Ranatra chinensis TaxID=642074 RepID=A0ABD0YLN2_9HEMI
MKKKASKSAQETRKRLQKGLKVRKLMKRKLKITIEENPLDCGDKPYLFFDANGIDRTPAPILIKNFSRLTRKRAEGIVSRSVRDLLADRSLILPPSPYRVSPLSKNLSAMYSVMSQLRNMRMRNRGAESLINMFKSRLTKGKVQRVDTWALPRRDLKLIYGKIPNDDSGHESVKRKRHKKGKSQNKKKTHHKKKKFREDKMLPKSEKLRQKLNLFQMRKQPQTEPSAGRPRGREGLERHPLKTKDSGTDMSAPSMFRLREDPPPRRKPITRTFSIMLQETETMFFFELKSKTAWRGTPEADEFLADAERYRESVNVVKTLLNAATQTINMASTTDGTCTATCHRRNQASLATASDLYDAMYSNETDTAKRDYEEMRGQVDTLKPAMVQSDSESEISESEEPDPDKLFCGANFRMKAMALERVITQNNFEERQLLFLGRCLPDPTGESVPFKYAIGHLWTYRTNKCYGKAVTSLSANPANDCLLAVSYGAYRYKDKDTLAGVICLWNTKNLYKPERLYNFTSGVTHVEFSSHHPHIIGASFSKGYVSIMDVSGKDPKVICHNKGTTIFALQPVWQIRWFVSEDGEQIPVSCSNNGRITLFRKDSSFEATNLLCVPRREGVLKGTRLLKKKCLNEVPLPKRPAVLCLAPHPSDPDIYLAGTDDGVVHKCSVNYLHEHLDAFAAHNGPVYNIEFHPVCENILLTCGADFRVRIWAYNVDKPLLELACGKYAIEHAAWSPANPLVIVSVGAYMIDIWDIRRKLTLPVSRFKTRLNSRLTRVCFSNSGHNIFVGDVMGNVQVFVLKYMPYDPTFKTEALADALKRTLVGQHEVLDELKRFGPPFD